MKWDLIIAMLIADIKNLTLFMVHTEYYIINYN